MSKFLRFLDRYKAFLIIAAVLIITGVVFLIIFLNQPQDNSDQTVSIPDKTITKVAPEPEPVYPKWPFLGTDNTESIENPVIAVKIEGSYDAPPYYGINEADIVIQERAEGEIARYIGIFNSQFPDRVEPIRSFRAMDPPILAQLNPASVFCSGGQGWIIQKGINFDLNMYTENYDMGYWRDDERYAPHNLALDLSVAKENLPEEYSKFTGIPYFTYAKSLAESTAFLKGTTKTKFTTVISSDYWIDWTWDPTQSIYLFNEEGEMTDDAYGNPIWTNNVVTMSVYDRNTQEYMPNEAWSNENLVVGTHQGQLYSGGKVIDIIISKEDDYSAFEFTTTDGKEILLSPGKAFIILEHAE